MDRPKIRSPGVREAAEVVRKARVACSNHSKQDVPQVDPELEVTASEMSVSKDGLGLMSREWPKDFISCDHLGHLLMGLGALY